jgi:hypothetical protein
MYQAAYKAALNRLTHSLLVVAAAAAAAACVNDAPAGPSRRAAPATRIAALDGETAGAAARGPELSGCEYLRAPEGSKLVAHLYATGYQIYHWNGTSWAFDGPSAVLYSDAAGNDPVGTHYAGPIWESGDGSTVRGSAPVACTVDPDAIPWLRLVGTPGATSGIFRRVTSIQRVNTVGGKIPVQPGTFVGEENKVPYTAEYFFYRMK